MTTPRLEEGIELSCTGSRGPGWPMHKPVPMTVRGNLSLRGAAGATQTLIAYECPECHKRVAVADEYPPISTEVLAEMDLVE